MPLIKGKSQKSFVKNLKTEMEHGKPQKQALAIAYSMKRKADKKKMAGGGEVKGVHKPIYSLGSDKGASQAGYLTRQDAPDMPNKYKKEERKEMVHGQHKKILDELKEMPKPKLEGLAKGGSVQGVHTSEYEMPAKEIKSKFDKHIMGESEAGEHSRMASESKGFQGKLSREEAIDKHHKVLGEMSRMPNPKLQGLAHGGEMKACKNCGHYDEGGPVLPGAQDAQKSMQDAFKSWTPHAEGGMIKENQRMPDMHAETSMPEEELVDRIMMKKSQDYSSEDRLAKGGYLEDKEMYPHAKNKMFDVTNKYSEGGKVANDGEYGQGASKNLNCFDDLVLDDDLTSSYGEDDNAGDSLGNKQEDTDRSDIIARIMKSRKKKDRMPNPA